MESKKVDLFNKHITFAQNKIAELEQEPNGASSIEWYKGYLRAIQNLQNEQMSEQEGGTKAEIDWDSLREEWANIMVGSEWGDLFTFLKAKLNGYSLRQEKDAVEFAEWIHYNQFVRYNQAKDGNVPYGVNKDSKENIWVSTKIYYGAGSEFYTAADLYRQFKSDC